MSHVVECATACERSECCATPGTWSTPGRPLVGRTVANAQFLRALLRHSRFDEISLFIGETADLAALERLTQDWNVPEERLAAYTVWQLPELLARGRLDVLHHASHVDRLYDLLATRDRFATRTVPVTGQIHSLSYPRYHQEFARHLLVRPSASDALFCSSTAGRGVIEKSLDRVEREAQAVGFPGALPRWNLPVVPLGVDLEAVTGGDRNATRRALNLPEDACLVTCLARFTEFDKLDLFPLLRVLERLVRQPTAGAPPVYLLLAGARQGTKTPEMLELWARHLGVFDRLRLKVDFADAEKKDLLAASDVFVSPVDNVQETFGQSVIEAMAAGLPVVVSDFDGYKDTVDAEVGVRVPTRLNADWAELSELAPLLYERPLHLVLGQSVEVDLAVFEAGPARAGRPTRLAEARQGRPRPREGALRLGGRHQPVRVRVAPARRVGREAQREVAPAAARLRRVLRPLHDRRRRLVTHGRSQREGDRVRHLPRAQAPLRRGGRAGAAAGDRRAAHARRARDADARAAGRSPPVDRQLRRRLVDEAGPA